MHHCNNVLTSFLQNVFSNAISGIQILEISRSSMPPDPTTAEMACWPRPHLAYLGVTWPPGAKAIFRLPFS